jgi:hypothetical protein
VEVRDALSKVPLANVEVSLSGGNPRPGKWNASTAADGSVRFDGLPAGTFFVSYKLAGYLDSRFSMGGRSVELKGDNPVETVTLLLTPSTSLDGTVFDEEGHPIKGVIVHTSFAEATTDAEGHYRLEHLTPGRWNISFRAPAAMRRQTLKRDEAAGESFGYPGVSYYPGVADARSATAVQISAGLDLHKYDVRLRRVPLVDFSGRAVSRPGGDALSGAHVELQTPNNVALSDETFQPRPLDDDGAFLFDMIQPGPYVLLVYCGEDGTGLPYVLPVDVGKQGLKNREIVVPPFATIEGLVRTKDGAKWRGEVSLDILSEQKGVAGRHLTLKEDHFVLEDLPPGQWQIALSAKVARVPDGKLVLASARFGATDPMTGPVLVTESGNPPLEIELSGDTGRIAGTVVGLNTGFVVVQRVGAPRSVFSMGTRVQEDRSFLTEDLAPGMYDVSISPVSPKVRVEVKSGETAYVRLERK